eukprot:5389617-Ditylum_brightwellii.AAC.1
MGDQQKYNEVGLIHDCVDAKTAPQISSEEFKNAGKKNIRQYGVTSVVSDINGNLITRRTWFAEVSIDRSVVPTKH